MFQAELAERELFLTNLRAELSAFEGQYIRQVGTRYGELDEWNVRIVEQTARIKGTEDALSAAVQARAQAAESSAAVHSEAATAQEFISSAELKTVYRNVIGRVHPDLTTDKDDRQEHLMAEANAAYRSGDEDALRRILDEYSSTSRSVRGTGIAPDLVSGNLQIRQLKSRLSRIEVETATLLVLDIAKLRAKVEAARTEGRELLAEMAQDLGSRIEFLRGVFEPGCPASSMTEGNERTIALMPGEPDALSRRGLACFVARGLMDLKANEEAEAWRMRVLFRGEGEYEEAAWCFRTGFELLASHAGSQFILGCAYLRGLGVIQDHCQAATWFRKAAEHGHGHAANNLGALCEHGLGVAQDYEQAFRWYFKAAGQGLAMAQFNLDKLHKNSLGATRGYARAAAHWYRTAAENGDIIDQRNLGLMYAQGKGLPPDDAEAAFWLRKAAQRGDAMAQETLGLMYALGKGVPKDRAEAVFWCCKAAQQGYEPAQRALSTLSRERGARHTKTSRSRSRVPLRTPLSEADTPLGTSASGSHGMPCLA